MKRGRWILLPLIMLPLTLVLLIPMLVAALAKRVVPIEAVTRACRRLVSWIAERWLAALTGLFRGLLDTRFEVEGDAATDPGCSYAIIANHQSWVDVPVLLWLFQGRVPFFRFFLKRGLIWMPLLGPAFWALEYPFVRFPSREELARRPERRGENLSAVRRACGHLGEHATTLVNFPEGALYTRERHAAQRARFHHLLSPRAGGTALALRALADRLDALIDVTLHFPGGPPSLGRFLTNRVERIRVHVRRIEVPGELTAGDYENDPAFRRRFQDWLNGIWREKDVRLDKMIGNSTRAAHQHGASPAPSHGD